MSEKRRCKDSDGSFVRGSYGVKRNAHSNMVQSEVLLDDLFVG